MTAVSRVFLALSCSVLQPCSHTVSALGCHSVQGGSRTLQQPLLALDAFPFPVSSRRVVPRGRGKGPAAEPRGLCVVGVGHGRTRPLPCRGQPYSGADLRFTESRPEMRGCCSIRRRLLQIMIFQEEGLRSLPAHPLSPGPPSAGSRAPAGPGRPPQPRRAAVPAAAADVSRSLSLGPSVLHHPASVPASRPLPASPPGQRARWEPPSRRPACPRSAARSASPFPAPGPPGGG